MIDASKFAKPMINPTGSDQLRFGVGVDECAAALRAMADAIERKEILVQNVQTGTVATPHDYTMHGVFIEFAEVEKVEGA
jgi:hypothetical protein